eukprot:12079405-Alexandrium_andersonii.AAC.1
MPLAPAETLRPLPGRPSKGLTPERPLRVDGKSRGDPLTRQDGGEVRGSKLPPPPNAGSDLGEGRTLPQEVEHPSARSPAMGAVMELAVQLAKGARGP